LVDALGDLAKPQIAENQPAKLPIENAPVSKVVPNSTPQVVPNQALPGAGSKAAVPAKVRKPEGLNFNETLRKKWGVMKRYTLVCELSVCDAQIFSILFSRLTTKLVDWHDERGDQSEAIDFDFYIPEWMFNKARKAVKQIVDSEGAYSFLQHLCTRVALHDTESDQVVTYVYQKE
jgi:hypothetical protein